MKRDKIERGSWSGVVLAGSVGAMIAGLVVFAVLGLSSRLSPENIALVWVIEYASLGAGFIVIGLFHLRKRRPYSALASFVGMICWVGLLALSLVKALE